MKANTPKETPILVTGATGMVGSYLLRYLIQDGFTNIRAMKRANSPMDLVQTVLDQVEWVECDLLDVLGLEDAIQGIDLVYHCAALISFKRSEVPKMMAVNKEGTANLVNVALHVGIKKMVYVSSIAAIGRPKDQLTIDENTKWEASPFNSNYGISKYLAEQEVWRGSAEGLNVAIVNPAMIIGGGFWDRGPLKMLELVRKEHGFYPMGANGFVDVRDVCRFMIHLMGSDISEERYVLSADSIPYRSFLSQIANSLEAKVPTRPIKKWIGEIAWRAVAFLHFFTGGDPTVTRESVQVSSLPCEYKNDKSLRVFGFSYLPLEQSITDMAELYRKAEKVELQPMFLPLT
ncbi:MAG: NAD-dependent epimerase/dehydratase family protein [Saprospiraceae bacterium]|nr:NAD-dependent epimerase/dehydratase family protein [Saprospiraceae bacterium]